MIYVKIQYLQEKISTLTSLLLESYRGGRTGTKFLRPSAEWFSLPMPSGIANLP